MFKYIRKYLIIAIATILPFSLVADDQSSPTIDPLRLMLLKELAKAEDAQVARHAESAVWQYWFSLSPTLKVREMLDAGMERREAYDYDAAERYFDQVIESAPEYAEGYNQRAFVLFLRENYNDAQADLEKTLTLEPDHFGALSGLFHILRRQNRQKAALSVLRSAVSVHPWLNEHTLLPEAMWPKNYRDIHETGQKI